MNPNDRLAFLAPLIVLSIAAVFAYLALMLLRFLGTGAYLLAIVLSVIVTGFFALLVLYCIVLLILMLAERIVYYTHKIKRHRLDFDNYRQNTTPRTPRATRNRQPPRTPYQSW